MARRSAGTGARTPTASPPGARPAGPCHSGPAPARPPWRPSAARTTTTDAGSVGRSDYALARTVSTSATLLELRLDLHAFVGEVHGVPRRLNIALPVHLARSCF